MPKIDKKNLRPSTIFRNEQILKVYNEVMESMGEYRYLVPKKYVYEQVRERTGYCLRKIIDVVNNYR